MATLALDAAIPAALSLPFVDTSLQRSAKLKNVNIFL
jgi:hypothetical protein